MQRILALRGGVAALCAATVMAALPAVADAPRTQPPTGSESPTSTPPVTVETFRNPPASVRPGTRWWWDSLLNPSAGVSLPDALEEVDAFADAGLGRLEIAWATASYATPEQRALLKAVAARAAERGLQLDMTLGDAWPWVTPATENDLAQQELLYGRTELSGPSTYSGEVPAAIGDEEPTGELVAVTAARVLEAGPAVTEPGSPPASSTVLDPASLTDLTALVKDGSLRWEVPPGDWILFGYWQRAVERSGHSGQPGNVVSLIDERSTRAGLGFTATQQVGEAAPEVRRTGHSFFEDSLELTSKGIYWSPSFFNEFRQRRGYDATKYLPLMFVQGVSSWPTPHVEPVPDFDLPQDEGTRYRYDYYSSLTDLYVDRHIKPIREWAKQYGMTFRTQPAYGNPFDMVRSSRESARVGALVDDESLTAGDSGTPDVVLVDSGDTYYDKPEDPRFHSSFNHYRTITSGSAQGGQLEVSTELGATFTHELHTFLRTYKRMMDKEWAAGVTRPLLHGVTHSPTGTPWPGASHFGGIVGESINHRTWPEWKHLKPLADYWGRGALVLQQGAARTDVAVLKDTFVGRPFDSKAINKAGFTVGFVDSSGVAERRIGPAGELFPDGPSYDALVIDGSQFYVGAGRLPVATAEAIDAASAKGLEVVFIGELPARGLSGKHQRSDDARVTAAVRRILARPTTRRVEQQADVINALSRLGSRPAAAWSRPAHVYSQARQIGDTTYYYLWNATADRQQLTGSFVAEGAPSALDLWNGTITPVAQYTTAGTRIELPLDLAPHETQVFAFTPQSRPHVLSTTADQVVSSAAGQVQLRDLEGGAQMVRLSDGSSKRVIMPEVKDQPLRVGTLDNGGLWQLQVTTVGPEGLVERPPVPLPALADWRTLPGLATESGTGTYTTTMTVPEAWIGGGRGSLLDLGTFSGSVQVFVNGQRVTADLDPQARIDVSRALVPGPNEVKVVLATTPFNKALVSPTTPITRPVFLNAAYGTQPYGLLSSVTLVPYARAEVALPRSPGTATARSAARAGQPPALGMLPATGGDPALATAATALVMAALLRRRRTSRLR